MSAPVRLGLGFQSNKAPADYERLALAAEQAGFDVVSVFGDLFFQPPLPALLAMARVTERIVLGPACLNPFMVHPVEIAGQIAALDVASSGRAYCGLARGSWLADLGLDQKNAPRAIAEAAAVVAALLAGEGDAVAGDRYRLPPGCRLRTTPFRRCVPMLVGTWGPRLAQRAAGFADEVKVGGSASPAMCRLMRRWIDEGTAAVGRDPAACGVVMGAVTVVDHDGVAARRRARQEVAMYLDVVAPLDRTVEVDPVLLARLRAHLRAGETPAAGALIPDAVLDLFAFAGTPQRVAAQALALIEAGASRIEFGTPHGTTDDLGVMLLGSEVLPAVRAALGAGRLPDAGPSDA